MISETVRRTSSPTNYISSKEIKHAEAAEEGIENLAEAAGVGNLAEAAGIENLAQDGIEHKPEMEIEVGRNDCKAVVLWKPPLMAMIRRIFLHFPEAETGETFLKVWSC